jgi:ATP-dependent Lon protease
LSGKSPLQKARTIEKREKGVQKQTKEQITRTVSSSILRRETETPTQVIDPQAIRTAMERVMNVRWDEREREAREKANVRRSLQKDHAVHVQFLNNAK